MHTFTVVTNRSRRAPLAPQRAIASPAASPRPRTILRLPAMAQTAATT